MENPFQKRGLAFPHESKSEMVQQREVDELEKMLEEVNPSEVLKEHGWLESNIPLNHPYWKVRP